jgi:hypothetical protein
MAYAQTPSVTGIQPAMGRQGGIVGVTFTGSGFSAPGSISISGGNGIRALSVQVNSATNAVATIVLGAPGTYSLQLATPGGTSTAQPFTVLPEEIGNAKILNVSTFAGPDGGLGADDGVGSSARFSGPGYVWGDGTYLYVADSENAIIRRVTLSTGAVVTIAGTPQRAGASDGAGPEVQFRYPWGVWGDGANLYITDTSNYTIRKLNLGSGAVTTIAGSAGMSGQVNGTGASALFVGPTGIWGDGTSLYVADTYNTSQRAIRKIVLATGVVTTVAALGNLTNSPANGVGLWGDGTNLWIADSSRDSIWKLVLASSQLTIFAGGASISGYGDATGTAARFYEPSAIWGGNGFLYIGDSYNNVIRQITISSGVVTTVAGVPQTYGAADGPKGAATLGDISGIWFNGPTAYISEFDNNTIRTVSLADGSVSTLAGKAAPSGSVDAAGVNARFSGPVGISGDQNSLYIADYINATIRAINPSTGAVTTLAGMPLNYGSADGQGAAASFYRPTGVWSDGQNLYVVDEFSNTIRKIVLGSGVVTTIAGNANAPCDSVDAVGTLARFSSPYAIWGDGVNLYVTDEYNFTIRKIVLGTLQVTTFAGKPGTSAAADGIGAGATFIDPTGIWGDGTYLYVVDGNSIRRITLATAQVVTIAGDPQTYAYVDGPAASARFNLPLGIWGDGSSLFVADYGNALIRKIDLNSLKVTTPVSQFPFFGSDNGSASAARFAGPIAVFGDGVNMYVLDFNNNNVRKITPVFNDIQFILTDRQTTTETSTGAGAGGAIQIGFATIMPNAGSTTPSGMVIFSYRPNGVLISEAAVPASPLIQSGRIYAEIAGPVNTGLAIANPNNQSVTINFYFTDASGTNLYPGSTTIGPYGQVAKFLSDSIYNTSGVADLSGMRSFTFNSSLPISVIALRGFNNERNDFLITTLPVAPTSAADVAPIIFPHYADGAGWTTKIILVNSTDSPMTGTIQFFTQGSSAGSGIPATVTATPIGGGATTGNTFSYTIAAGSAYKLTTAGTATLANLSGWVRVTPDAGLAAPVGLLVFSNRPGAVTVSESGLSAIPLGSAFRVYTQSNGVFTQKSSMQTGIAIANPTVSTVTVTLELLRLDGTSTGFVDTVQVPANGAYANTLNYIAGLAGAPVPFQGLLRISGANVAVAGLRIQYNERGDYMITTTTPVNEASIPSTSEYVFPHLVDAGGYTTELILFSGSAGQSSSGTVRFYAVDGEPSIIAFQ